MINISPLNEALQQQLGLTHVELDDVICASLKSSLLQKMTPRHYQKNDQKLYESIVIVLNTYWDVYANCLNTRAICLRQVYRCIFTQHLNILYLYNIILF